MTYDLTDPEKQLLTEKVLGECWTTDKTLVDCQECSLKCLESVRTFTTPQDAHDLAKKLVEMGKWDDFMTKPIDNLYDEDNPWSIPQLFAWLFAEPESPKRVCRLVWEFMKQEEK
jgi:hypothetical protein